MYVAASPFDAPAEPSKELSTVEEEAEGQELSIWKSPMTTRARESSQGRRCAVESVLFGRRQGPMPHLPLPGSATHSSSLACSWQLICHSWQLI